MKSKVIIIGGGPIGLYLAAHLNDYLLLEASDKLGGQLINLYPEKDIIDIDGIECIKAKDYVKYLVDKIDLNKVKLNEKVIDIKGHKVITSKGEYEGDYIVIATGLGFSSPRPLGIENENKCSNILYKLNDFLFMKDKRVAIFGGGDSALDWAKQLSKISDHVSLIHRRTEFRGNHETIKDCKNLKLYLPFVPYSLIEENGKCIKITIKKVSETENTFVDLYVDYVLVNYGQIAEQSVFPFEKDGNFLKVNDNHQINDYVFAIGDASSYENKKRRIAPGVKEANTILKIIG